MADIDGTPIVWMNFSEKGRLINNPKPLEALRDAIASAKATDILVLAHGWKNEQSHARQLYTGIWKETRKGLQEPNRWVIVGIGWPSVAFPKDFDDNLGGSVGGALSAHEPGTVEDLDEETFIKILSAAMPEEADRALREAALAVGNAMTPENKDAFAQEFARRLQEKFSRNEQDGEQVEDDFDVPSVDEEVEKEASIIAEEVENNPDLLFAVSFEPFVPADTGGAAGANISGSALKGPKATIARIANQFTYYPMKRRAGTVGRMLGAYLDPQPALVGIRLHLVGHSFGARLVTACASQMKILNPKSLTLLQAAFSHNGFVAAPPNKRGYFADVLEKKHKDGATTIAVTHTHNDRACAFFYPLASRLSGDGKSNFGGADDPYGAMGANGAQSVKVVTHQGFPNESSNMPQKGEVNNYLADQVVVADPGGLDAHNNITNAGVGRLIGDIISL